MAYHDRYRRQVMLMMRVMPLVAEEGCFALKGGTAINFFYRNMPRLSVDIDLTYVHLHDRARALRDIGEALERIAERVRETLPTAAIQAKSSEGAVHKLFIRANQSEVKIEVSPVLRGLVHDPEVRPVSDAVEDMFGYAEMNVVAFEDLYAGKLVAALDRQHPRDLFDVRDLLANEGLTDPLREAFVVYLLSHNRPMGEVLSCRRKDISTEFRSGFEGMTEHHLSVDDLITAREHMIDGLISEMPDRHRRFLFSFERRLPRWDLLNVPHAPDLPAVRWREQNLETRNQGQRDKLLQSLERSLKERD